jgi:phage/conjugal plasmid C-4 type zinc finger TraR family protein
VDEIDYANDRGQLFIDAALTLHATIARQNTPSTGVCHSCGELIERERLRANAHAHHCYDCASEQEAERLRVRRRGAR